MDYDNQKYLEVCDPQCPEKELVATSKQALASHVGFALAGHANSTPEVLEKVADTFDPGTLKRVLAHPKTPKKTQRAIETQALNGYGPLSQTQLAKNAKGSKVLKHLSKSPKITIRVAVADNPATPKDVLRQLATDPHWKVRQHALKRFEK